MQQTVCARGRRRCGAEPRRARRGGYQSQRRGPAGRAACPRPLSCGGRRGRRPSDTCRPRQLPAPHRPAGERPGRCRRPGRRSARSVALSSASASSVSELSVGTFRHSSSGSSGSGSARRPSTDALRGDGQGTRAAPGEARLAADGIAGKQTFRTLGRARRAGRLRRRPAEARRPRGRELLLDRGALRRQPAAACEGQRPEALGGDRPGQRLTLPPGTQVAGPGNASVYACPSLHPRYARRSTTGRPRTASIRVSRVRLRGWSRGSRRMSSRTSAPSG